MYVFSLCVLFLPFIEFRRLSRQLLRTEDFCTAVIVIARLELSELDLLTTVARVLSLLNRLSESLFTTDRLNV